MNGTGNVAEELKDVSLIASVCDAVTRAGSLLASNPRTASILEALSAACALAEGGICCWRSSLGRCLH